MKHKDKAAYLDALLNHAFRTRDLTVSGNVVTVTGSQLSRRDSATVDGLRKYHGYRVIRADSN